MNRKQRELKRKRAVAHQKYLKSDEYQAKEQAAYEEWEERFFAKEDEEDSNVKLSISFGWHWTVLILIGYLAWRYFV